VGVERLTAFGALNERAMGSLGRATTFTRDAMV
jgi:hypothetical protein